MKNALQKLLIKNTWFFTPILIFYGFAIYRLIAFNKIDNHIFFNQFVGNPFIDNVFKYATFLGDGWFIIIFAILWLLINIRQSILILLSYIISGIIVAILKNYVFNEPRPHFVFDYFYKHIAIKYVDGVEVLALNSFPSGHSTAAFAFFTCLAFLSHNNRIKLLLSFLSLIVIYSRVHLSQHWLRDIIAGSLLGLMTSILIYLIFEQKKYLLNMNKSILKFKSN